MSAAEKGINPLIPGPSQISRAEALLGVPLMLGFRPELADIRMQDPAGILQPRIHEIALAHASRLAVMQASPDVHIPSRSIPRAASSAFLNILKGRVAMANNYIEARSAPYRHPRTDADDTPRARVQGGMHDALFKYIMTAPQSLREVIEEPSRAMLDGFLIQAPPGAGKTKIQADWIRQVGVGQPLGGPGGRRRQAVVFLSTVDILRQYCGDTGDTSFRDYLGPGITITRFFGDEKNLKGDVILSLPDSWLIAVNNGSLHPESVGDTKVYDEAHSTVLEPRMLGQVALFGQCNVMFTATPSMGKYRDLRKIVPYHDAGTLTSFIRQKISRKTELYTYRADSIEQQEMIAFELVKHYVQQGKRVGVYCKPGDHLFQARALAAQLNGLKLDLSAFGYTEDHAWPVACVVGIGHDDKKNIPAFNSKAGPVVYLATGKLKEGFNGPVDVGVIIGNRGSMTELVQICGRVPRPGEGIATIIEINSTPQTGHLQHSIWEVFGLETIEQGYVVGSAHDLAMGDIQPRQQGRRAPMSGEIRKVSGVIESLQEYLLENCLVRESLVAPQDAEQNTPKEGYEALDMLATEFDLPALWLQHTLDKQGIAYMGIWERGPEALEYGRWYAAVAREYLQQRKEAGALPTRTNDAVVEMSAPDIACQASVSTSYVRKIASRLGVKTKLRFILTGKKNAVAAMYNEAGIRMIQDEIDRTPIAEEYDIPFEPFCMEVGRKFARDYCDTHDIERRQLRYHPSSNKRGIAAHITEHDAIRIVVHKQEQRTATEAHISLIEVAELAGTTLGRTIYQLNETERENRISLWPNIASGTLPRSYLPRAMGMALAERIKPKQLPPHLVPVSLFLSRTNASRTTLTRYLTHKYPDAPKLQLTPKGRPSPCYPIQELMACEQNPRFGLAHGQPEIDHERVVTGPDDLNQDRWNYTQEIQKMYIDAGRLAAYPAKAVPSITAAEAAPLPQLQDNGKSSRGSSRRTFTETYQRLGCTPLALSLLCRMLAVSERLFMAEEDVSPEGQEIEIQRIQTYCEQQIPMAELDELSFGAVRSRLRLTDDKILAVLAKLKLVRNRDYRLARSLSPPHNIDLHYYSTVLQRIRANI
jgi:hypothetical protein